MSRSHVLIYTATVLLKGQDNLPTLVQVFDKEGQPLGKIRRADGQTGLDFDGRKYEDYEPGSFQAKVIPLFNPPPTSAQARRSDPPREPMPPAGGFRRPSGSPAPQHGGNGGSNGGVPGGARYRGKGGRG